MLPVLLQIGQIDMSQWVEFLLQHQMIKDVQGYRLCEKSISELKKMLRLVVCTGSTSAGSDANA